MSRSVPPLLFSLVFSEADSGDWEDIAGLFAKQAGELTDDEIERLLALRKMVAERAQTLGHTLRSVRDSLRRLLSSVEEIAEQTTESKEGETSRQLLRLLSGQGLNNANTSALERELLLSLTHTVMKHSPAEHSRDSFLEEQAPPPPVQQKPRSPAVAVASDDAREEVLYPSEQPSALESADNTAPKEAFDPPIESEGKESPSLASQILRQAPEQATPASPAVPPVAPAVVHGDYTELSDVAVWQAISSGAARIPSDLQRLRRQKGGQDKPEEPRSPRK